MEHRGRDPRRDPQVKPHVVVTFPIHGISGFHDHIVTVNVTKPEEIDCAFDVTDADMERFH